MARKDITMTGAETLAFLESGHTLQVSSIGKDGTPHLAPMWYIVDDGKIVFRSFTKSQKIVNLLRNPRLAVLVERGEAYADLQGVMIRGRSRLVTDRSYVLAVYGGLAARYAMVGDARRQLSPEELEAAFGRFADKNTAVVVEPDHIATWDHTKLDGGY